jgi:hypothetical protein
MDLDDFRQASSGVAKTNLASVAIAVELARAEGIWHTMGEAWDQWRTSVAWGEALTGLVPWLILGGLVVAGWRLFRRRDEFQSHEFSPMTVGLIVVVVLLTVPILFYVRHTTYLQNYYFIYFYPLLFVIMVLPTDLALTWASASVPARQLILRTLSGLLVVLVVALAGWEFWLNHVGLQLTSQYAQAEKQVTRASVSPRKAGFTTDAQQIRHVQQAINTFADWNLSHPDCDLIIASNGYQPEGSILGQVGEFLFPRPVRYVRLGAGTIVPRTCGLYLVASDNAAIRTWYEGHAALLPDLTIRLPGDAWHFFEMPSSSHEAWIQALTDSPVLGRWDNGVQLRGYAVTGGEQAGSPLGLALTWEVYGIPPKRRYHFFNHLLDENGTLVTQADGPGVFSYYWQPGEFFVTWFEMTLPTDLAPGLYYLVVGLYDWPSLERPLLTDGWDNLPLTSIEIP